MILHIYTLKPSEQILIASYIRDNFNSIKFRGSAMSMIFFLYLLSTINMSSAEPVTSRTTCGRYTCGEYQTCVVGDEGSFCMECWHKRLTCGTADQFPGCAPYCWNELKQKYTTKMQQLNQTCSANTEQLQERIEKLVEEAHLMNDSIKVLNQRLLASTSEAVNRSRVMDQELRQLSKSLLEEKTQRSNIERDKNALQDKHNNLTQVLSLRLENFKTSHRTLESQFNQLETHKSQLETDNEGLMHTRTGLIFCCAILFVTSITLGALFCWKLYTGRENKMSDDDEMGETFLKPPGEGHGGECYGDRVLHNVNPVQRETDSDIAM